MVVESRNPSFVPVKCRCGRALRAKWDQVGTEIRCWDCHQPVLVPLPNPRARVASAMYGRFRTTLQGPDLSWLITLGAILTGALTIPVWGLGVASVLLIFLAAAYGETIRAARVGPEGAEFDWRSLPRPRSVAEWIACPAMVAGTVVPLWVIHAAPQRSPHLDRVTLGILGLSWAVMPVVMALVYGRGAGESSGGRGVLAILRRHLWILGMTVLVVPIGFLATEAWLDFVFYMGGGLPFFALEHMPIPGEPRIYLGIPHYESFDFRLLPQGQFIRAYFDGLRHGYSFVGTIPPSLSMSTRAGLNPSIIRLMPLSYAIVRFVLVVLIVTCLLASFLIQARWLGYLTLLEGSRGAERSKAIESRP